MTTETLPPPVAKAISKPAAAKAPEAPIRVMATKVGTYPAKGDIYPVVRQPGDVFELNDPAHFAEDGNEAFASYGWMRRLEADEIAKLEQPKPSAIPQTTGRRKNLSPLPPH